MATEEDLEELDDGYRNPGWAARIATVVVFVLLGIAAYLYLDSDSGAKDPSQLPLITENHPPEKTKPENPGGMDIPHQDASVYDHLENGNTAEPDKLMPAEEKPIAAAPITPPTAPATIPDALPSLPAAPPPQVAAAPPEPAPQPPPQQADAAPAAPADNLAKLVTEEAAAVPPATDLNSRMQLGALPSQDAAQAEWLRVKKQYSDELSGLDAHFTPVNLGDKGTYVRIQTDVLTQDDAEARCQKIKAAGQACMVVKAAQN